MTRISICALLALAVIAGGTVAQCPGHHATTALTLNGTDPGTVMGNLLSTGSPYSVDLDVVDSGGANLPFIFIAGSNNNCGAVPAIPGQLTIDLDGAQVIADGTGTGLGVAALAGLANTPMNLSMAFPTGIWAGVNSPSFQAVIADPTAGAVPFASTSAGAVFFSNATTTTYTLPDDGGIAHNLAGAGVMFGGVAQNPICLNSNGQISFGAIVGDFTPTMAEHFNGWSASPSGNNGVSIMYCDMNRGGLGSSTSITENTITGDVTVNYDTQNWWNANEPAGNFSATFVGPLLTLDYSGLIAQVAGTDPFIVGVTNGDSTVGTDSDISVSAGGLGTLGSLGAYVSASAPDSIGDEMAAGDAVALAAQGMINYLDISAYEWTIF